MSAKICILTQSHLCRNPRVLKEAVSLADNGYQVAILNCISRNALWKQDLDLVKCYPSITITPVADLTTGGVRTFSDRLIFKIGCLLVKYLKIESPLALGYGAPRYFKISKQVNADLYICHQELATYVGTRLIRSGYKVAFDLEDWYSADLLPEARKKRPGRLLERTERIALQNGAFCTTTSNAMANAMASKYKSKKPQVIYNAFPYQAQLQSIDKTYADPLKLFWFSQTIGPGRGIEEFIHLLKFFRKELSLNLLGDIAADYEILLRSIMPSQHTIVFHALVDERDLPRKIADFDIGLALELTNPPSRDYTITNKFFQYLQAGLPVIATETAGQKEIIDQQKIGIMFPQNPASGDMERLIAWVNDIESIRLARRGVKMAALYYSWERESAKLLNLVGACSRNRPLVNK